MLLSPFLVFRGQVRGTLRGPVDGNTCTAYKGAAAQCYPHQPALWAFVEDEFGNGIAGATVTFAVSDSTPGAALLFKPENVNALKGDSLVLKIPYHGDPYAVTSSPQITDREGRAFMEMVVLYNATVTVTAANPLLAGKGKAGHHHAQTPPGLFLRVMNYHDVDQLAGYGHKRLPFPITVRAFKQVDGMAEPVNANIKFRIRGHTTSPLICGFEGSGI